MKTIAKGRDTKKTTKNLKKTNKKKRSNTNAHAKTRITDIAKLLF